MTTHANSRVVLVLMKSPEADATLKVLREDQPQLSIQDRGPYWHISGDGEIVVDLRRVGDELGDPLTLSQWLVVMSTFVGRVETEPDYFRLTSKMLEFESSTTAAR